MSSVTQPVAVPATATSPAWAAAAAAEPPYLSTFGLTRAPFAGPVDDAAFFCDRVLRQRLDLLTHVSEFGALIVLVSGAAGSGKTTLLQRFIAQASAHWRICRIEASNAPGPLQLAQQLALLCQATGEQGASATQLDQALRAHRLRMLVPMLAIDGAQALSDETLHYLVTHWGRPRSPLRVILFGEPQLQDRMDRLLQTPGGEKALHTVHLPPLTEPQVAAYLVQRWQAAGATQPLPLGTEQIAAIQAAAGGLPGRIDALAHDQLLQQQAAMTQRPERSRSALLGLRTAAALVGALILGALFFFAGRTPETPPGVATDTDTDTDAGTPDPAIAPLAVTASSSAARAPAAGTPAQPVAPTPASTPVVDTAETSAAAAAGLPTPGTLPARATTPPAAPAPQAAVRTADRNGSTGQNAQEQTTVAAAAGAPQSAAAVPASAPAASAAAVLLELDGARLLSWPAEQYTIQFFSSRDAERAQRFIAAHPQLPDPGVYRTRYRDLDWYSAVAGRFDDAQAAQAAAMALPREAGTEPMVRRLAEVQADIRRALPAAADE